jgi:predicted nucleic acid-binding protein
MIDANVLIAGITYPRWPYEVLQHGLRGDFQLVLSPTVIADARRVIDKTFPAYAQDYTTFLDLCEYEEIGDPTLDEVAANSDLVRDIKDVPVALSAIGANVDYLVSNDDDLAAEDASTERLRQLLRVIRVGPFLRYVMRWSDEELQEIRTRNWLG